MRIKVCGITRPEDARLCEAAGVDALGFIFAKHSKRYLSLEHAKHVCAAVGPFVARVGVFVDAPLRDVEQAIDALRLQVVQLHGQEDPAYAAQLRQQVQVVRALAFHEGLEPKHLASYPADAFLLDGLTPGSGESFAWQEAQALCNLPKLILAGGLHAGNVGQAIATLQPYAVDVASGVESSPGIKDPSKVQDFVRAVREQKLSTG